MSVNFLSYYKMHRNQALPIKPEMRMSEVILNNYYLILMLEHFGINLYVSEKTVEEICCENNINPEVFLTFANLFNGVKYSPKKEFSFEDLLIIINYLNNCHQYYLEEKCPQIHTCIQEMYEVDNQSDLLMVEKFFKEYEKEVTEHLNYETQTIFPYITSLFQKLKYQIPDVEINDYSVNDYKEHHEDIEEKLSDLKNLLIRYLPVRDDQKIRRRLLFNLFELENDLHVHSQIEDSILIPLVEKMEKQLRNNADDEEN